MPCIMNHRMTYLILFTNHQNFLQSNLFLFYPLFPLVYIIIDA